MRSLMPRSRSSSGCASVERRGGSQLRPGVAVELDVATGAVGRRGGAAARGLGHGDDCRPRDPCRPRAQFCVSDDATRSRAHADRRRMRSSRTLPAWSGRASSSVPGTRRTTWSTTVVDAVVTPEFVAARPHPDRRARPVLRRRPIPRRRRATGSNRSAHRPRSSAATSTSAAIDAARTSLPDDADLRQADALATAVAGPAHRPRDRQSAVPVADGEPPRPVAARAVAAVAPTRTSRSSSSPSPANWSTPTADASHSSSRSRCSRRVTPPTSERRSASGPIWSGRGGPAAGCSTRRCTCAHWPSNSDAPNRRHVDRTGRTWSRAVAASPPCLPTSTTDGHARRSGSTQRQLPRRVLRHDPCGRRSRQRTTADHLRSRRPGPVVVGRATDHVRQATLRAAARRPRPARRPHDPMGATPPRAEGARGQPDPDRRSGVRPPGRLAARRCRCSASIRSAPTGTTTIGARPPSSTRSVGDRCGAHVTGCVGLAVASGRRDRAVGRRDPARRR